MTLSKCYCNDISRVYNWYGKYGLKVIPVNFDDMNETINPYEFYLCEDSDRASADIDAIRKIAYPFPYWAIKVGPYINIITIRVIEKEGGFVSFNNNRQYNTLKKDASTIKTPIGYDYLVKVEHDWLISQLPLVSETFYEYKGHNPDSIIYKLIQSDIEEKPYYKGHSLKQIQVGKGVYLILDGFVIVPPSQWYSWEQRKNLNRIPHFNCTTLMI